jgi:hypothetical protein
MISIILAGCEKPTKTLVVPTTPPGPSQTWIDSPLPNARLHLQPYTLIFHGASFVGVTEFEIEINGTVEASVSPNSTGSGGSEYGQTPKNRSVK